MDIVELIDQLATHPAALPVAIIGFIGITFVFAAVFGRVMLRGFMNPNANLLETGESGEAIIIKTWQTGVSVNDQPQVGMLLQIEIPGRGPYQVEHKQVIPLIHISVFQPGARMPVKVDPNNPARLALDIYEQGP